MSYIGASISADESKVLVWERINGERVVKEYDIPYYFYYPDENGPYTSMYGDTLSKKEIYSEFQYTRKEWDKIRDSHLAEFGKLFESDIDPVVKVLMNNYYGKPAPNLNVGFIDIEVDADPNIGFSTINNPYSEITAITIYKRWLDEYIVLAVPPKEYKGNLGETLSLDEFDDYKDEKAKLFLFKSEKELLGRFITEIRDVDVLTGWNSEFYDMPMLLRRVAHVLDGVSIKSNSQENTYAPTLFRFDDYKKINNQVKHFCFEKATPPSLKIKPDRFGVDSIVSKIWGRSHLDYLRLFKKFTFEGRTSWSLNSVLEDELNIQKLSYEGTLIDLYRKDFEHYIKYNLVDVVGLKRLDDKRKFIQLANNMAHQNTVLLESVLGTVLITETGVANHAHNVLNVIVCDKPKHKSHDKVEGAIVLNPKIGLHWWLGSVDINSLYPNTIRSINISPECIIGQFEEFEKAWFGIRNKDNQQYTLAFEEPGKTRTLTGAEWNEELLKSSWAVSAYGTVFNQEKEGIIPSMLGYWYSERKKMQAEKKKWTKKIIELKEAGASKEEITEARVKEEEFDLLQHTMKISLNSAYGALLNLFFRFSDPRMGASVTATGRQITTHMMGIIGEVITGLFAELIKTTTGKKEDSNEEDFVNFIEYENKDSYLALPSSRDINVVIVQNSYVTDNDAIIYGDTDSVEENSLITINGIKDTCKNHWQNLNGTRIGHKKKEFLLGNFKTLAFENNEIKEKNVKAFYRHKVTKDKWKITLENNQFVIVTEDHSIMVKRNGKLIEVKPQDINRDTDICISIKETK
jgi:DNA polymerase elongation subunit (family B)